MTSETTPQAFLQAVEEQQTLQEIKHVFPKDEKVQYDKQYNTARNWLQYYQKCGMVVVEKQAVPHGNFQYRFSLTQKGKRFLDNG